MTEGIILEANDVKKLIAEHYDVPVENVIKAQYSYIVKKEDKKKSILNYPEGCR